MTDYNTWLTKVEENRKVLTRLIRTYHPRCKKITTKPSSPEITAPNAQSACNTVIDHIKRRSEGMPTPLELFDIARKNGDHAYIYKLLDETWFGVPESTSCWNIPGFSLSVDLIEEYQEIEPTVLRGGNFEQVD